MISPCCGPQLLKDWSWLCGWLCGAITTVFVVLVGRNLTKGLDVTGYFYQNAKSYADHGEGGARKVVQ